MELPVENLRVCGRDGFVSALSADLAGGGIGSILDWVGKPWGWLQGHQDGANVLRGRLQRAQNLRQSAKVHHGLQITLRLFA